MEEGVISIDYDRMKSVSDSFRQESDAVKQTLSNLRTQVQVLQGGKWKAPAATKFYNKMNDEVLQGVSRLEQALVKASEVSNSIITELRGADEEACACLPNN